MFVPPLPNRLVIFGIWFGYSHQWNPHRITLAFKLKKHYNKDETKWNMGGLLSQNPRKQDKEEVSIQNIPLPLVKLKKRYRGQGK